jgi:ethanolamine utilization protein EutA
MLPLNQLPILGNLTLASSDEHIRDVLELVAHSCRGGCVQVTLGTHAASAVRTFGEQMAAALQASPIPEGAPLVLLARENLGKVLGHYVTRWGALPVNLVVIDEVSERDAQFVQIGAAKGQVVPVSFYGLNEK